MSAQDNGRAPVIVPILIGTQAATITLPGPLVRKRSRIKQIVYVDQAGVAADNTNFLQLSLQIGATVLATLDTRAANDGALTALVGKALSQTGEIDVPALSQLKVVVTKNGTGVPTLGQLYVEMYPL